MLACDYVRWSNVEEKEISYCQTLILDVIMIADQNLLVSAGPVQTFWQMDEMSYRFEKKGYVRKLAFAPPNQAKCVDVR